MKEKLEKLEQDLIQLQASYKQTEANIFATQGAIQILKDLIAEESEGKKDEKKK